MFSIGRIKQGIPVYKVSRKDGTGKKKTLHINLLLPISNLCYDEANAKTMDGHDESEDGERIYVVDDSSASWNSSSIAPDNSYPTESDNDIGSSKMSIDESSADGMGTDKVLGDVLHSNVVRHGTIANKAEVGRSGNSSHSADANESSLNRYKENRTLKEHYII